MADTMTAQSYGGGIQSVALAVLNATGRVDGPAKLAIFSDPGSEESATYQHIEVMRPWLAERGTELVTIETTRNGGLPLYEYVMERSTVIPVKSEKGLGRRQCTQNWKVDAINAELRRRGATHAIVQLDISIDEVHRMKDSRTKWVEHAFPLVDQRITRRACELLIRDAGLPVPPKSRCTFCPLQTVGDWHRRRAEHPDSFEQAAVLEDAIVLRAVEKGRPPAYLSSRLRPLREAFPPGQQLLELDEPEDDCGGYCFT